MKLLWCENAVNPHSHREICMHNIKVHYERECKCEFKEHKDGDDILYEYKNASDYFCLRTVNSLPDEEKWISKMTQIINDFCSQYEDGYIVIHLGVGGYNNTNYYNYPAVRALMTSNIEDNHVIVYTTFSVSLITFYEETSDEYRLISTTQTSELINEINSITKE